MRMLTSTTAIVETACRYSTPSTRSSIHKHWSVGAIITALTVGGTLRTAVGSGRGVEGFAVGVRVGMSLVDAVEVGSLVVESVDGGNVGSEAGYVTAHRLPISR